MAVVTVDKLDCEAVYDVTIQNLLVVTIAALERQFAAIRHNVTRNSRIVMTRSSARFAVLVVERIILFAGRAEASLQSTGNQAFIYAPRCPAHRQIISIIIHQT